jgi:hypothetical protein
MKNLGGVAGSLTAGWPPEPARLVIPAALLGRVREAAYVQLAGAADGISVAARAQLQPRHESHLSMDRAWSLLDAIGWRSDEDTGAEIELDIAEHGGTLRDLLAVYMPLMPQWVDELEPGDPRLPDRAHELRQMREFAAELRE